MSMDHDKAKEHFSDFWEQASGSAQRSQAPSLDATTRQAVEEHLSSCASCRAEYERFEQAMAPLGKLHRIPAPDMIGTVPALIHQRSQGRFFGPKSWVRKIPFEQLSLAMLALVVLIYILVKLSQPAVHLH